MTDASGKIPLLLTPTQLDLLGKALMEHIPQVANRVSKATKMGIAHEEVSLLKAYLELAKIIMDRNDATAGGGWRKYPIEQHLKKERMNGPSPLQSPELRLRQP